MKLIVTAGTTSKRVEVFIQDSTSTVGAGLTGLTNASAGLTWYYAREDDGNAGGTSVSIVAGTRGTFTSGGFIEKDSANMPGVYEIGVPNAVLAAGAKWATMFLKGATNMVQLPVEIQLNTFDLNSSTVTLAASQITIKKNTALAAFPFALFNSAGAPVTGSTVTPTRSIDGAAFAACANAVAEVSGGWYKIDLAASDLNGNTIALRFAGSAGALDADYTIVTQP